MNKQRIVNNFVLEDDTTKFVFLNFLLDIYQIQKQYQDTILKFINFENCQHVKIVKEDTIQLVGMALSKMDISFFIQFEEKIKNNKVQFYFRDDNQKSNQYEEELAYCDMDKDELKAYISLTETILDGSNLIHEFMHLTNESGETNDFCYIHECLPFLCDFLFQNFLKEQEIGTQEEQNLLQLQNDYNIFFLNQLLIEKDEAYFDKDATASFISHTLALVISTYLLETVSSSRLFHNVLEWNEDLSYQYCYEFFEELGLKVEVKNGILQFQKETRKLLLECYKKQLQKKEKNLKKGTCLIR